MTYCCVFNYWTDLMLLVFVVIPFISFLLPDPDNKVVDNRYVPISGKHICEKIDLSKMGANAQQNNEEHD